MSGFHLFTLAKIPVRVSPWFLLIPLYLVGSLGFGAAGVRYGVALTLCVLASVLAHEFGHAVMARRYQLGPQIMVHAFGGHTAHQRARTQREEALIVAAGPLSGLLLAVLSLGLLSVLTPANVRAVDLVRAAMTRSSVLHEVPMTVAVLYVLIVLNTVWSLFNLLPIWPLDGGQLLRLSLHQVLKPMRAEKVTHVLGLVGVGLLALAFQRFAGLSGGFWTMLILAGMAFRNVQALTASRAEPVRKENNFARELMLAAERAHERGDDDEAARLCHQIRAEGSVPQPILARTWAMLGVIATRKGNFDEALSYLRRAPDALDVVEATAQCLYQLGMYDALTQLTATRAFNRLPNETRRAILDALHEAVA